MGDVASVQTRIFAVPEPRRRRRTCAERSAPAAWVAVQALHVRAVRRWDVSAPCDAQALAKRVSVRFRRPRRDGQLVTDLLVGEAGRNELRYLLLTRCDATIVRHAPTIESAAKGSPKTAQKAEVLAETAIWS